MNFMPKIKNIKLQIIHITVGAIFIIMLLIVSICWYCFHNLLTNSLIESTSYQLQLINSSLSADLNPIINLSNWCAQKNVLVNYLSCPQEPSSALANSAWQQLSEEYQNNISKSYIKRIVIGNSKKNYLHVSSIASFNAFNMVNTIRNLSYFDTLYHNQNLWIGIVSDPFSDLSTDKMIPLIRPIYSKFNSQTIGWNYISISTNILNHALNQDTLPSDSNFLLTLNDKTYNLLDPNFEELHFSFHSSQTITKKNYYVTRIKDSTGHKRTYVTLPASINGWYLSQSLSESEFVMQRKIYVYLIILFCFITLSLGIGLAFYLSKIINHPLNNLLNKISNISLGDFSYDPNIEWPNEFGEIGRSINSLSTNVMQLMNHRIQTEKEKKELEYQILQSQINPHFLYNTLNSIKWMATIQNATGIAEMTTSLSKLMRAVSKDTEQLVTLKDELDLLNHYFLIQKYRYGGTITLTDEIVDAVLYNCRLPKFTLQPIVENAIFHGIEPKGEAGSITVKASLVPAKKWVIEITDTGIGMFDEQIKSLLSSSSSEKGDFFKKIGLNNVNQRIKYNFGSAFGLNISSCPGHYTTISILLPIMFNQN